MFTKILFVFLFISLFFLIRSPSYDAPLVGEDGLFSDIFINQPARPAYGQTARINGKEIYGNLAHPSPLYEWLELSGKVFNKIFPLEKLAVENHKDLSYYLRFSFSCFQLLAWLMLLVYVLTLEKNVWKNAFLLLALAISSPAITYSLWIQIDNSSGSIIAGLLMMAVLLWDRFNTIKRNYLLGMLFFAGFISAMGKNEWSILVFLALLTTWGYIQCQKKFGVKVERENLLGLLFLLIGLIAGNIISFLISPVDYLGGLGLMNHMAHSSSLLNNSQVGNWWAITKARLPVLYLGLALWLYASLIFIRKDIWKISVQSVLAYFISSAFLWSFFLSSWDPTDRYFIPAFVSLIYTLFLFRKNYSLELDKYYYLIIMFLFLDAANFYSVSLSSNKYRVAHYEDYLKTLPTKKDCINFIEYYAFNLEDIDYVGVGNGVESLEAHMQKSGLKKCE